MINYIFRSFRYLAIMTKLKVFSLKQLRAETYARCTHYLLNMRIPGVLQKSQQWEVHPEGPAGCPDAESPQVPSPSTGKDAA